MTTQSDREKLADDDNWIERLGVQYGARQLAALRGDAERVADCSKWMSIIAKEHWHEIIAALRAPSGDALLRECQRYIQTIHYGSQIELLERIDAHLSAASAGGERLGLDHATDWVRYPWHPKESDARPLDHATLEAVAKFVEHYCAGNVPASTIALYLPNKIRALASERT